MLARDKQTFYWQKILNQRKMKKILLVLGHPDKNSFNFALADAYKQGAMSSGAVIEEIIISELNFNPNLQFGYNKRTELEPDLLQAWEKIKRAEHIVFIYPLWWGFMPAVMKGFFDRLFLPGFAFRYRENSALWDKLLTDKTAHIICTMDYPVWYYKWLLRESGIKTMRTMILDFCGITTTQTTYIAPIRNSNAKFRNKWLEKTTLLGKKQK